MRSANIGGTFLLRVGSLLLGCSLIVAVLIGGPSGVVAKLAVGIAFLWGISFLPQPPLRILIPLSVVLLATLQVAPGVFTFELIMPIFVIAAFLESLRHGRAAWDVRGPGLVALANLIPPLFAVPMHIVSWVQFIGGYKVYVGAAVLFFALRRLVRPERSAILLWAYPVFGVTAAFQLLGKVSGLGIRLERLGLRNFYTDLGWGLSNYVGAIMAMCICGCILLFMMERRLIVRAVLVLAIAIIFQGIFVSYARGPTVALAVFVFCLVLGLSPRARIVTLVGTGLAAVGFMLAPTGRILLFRFVDPSQLASMGRRFVLWDEAWHRFLSNPWTGVGLTQGQFQNDRMGTDGAHNTILDYLNEQGIFGLVGYLILMIAIFRLCARATPTTDEATNRGMRVAALGFALTVVTNSMVEVTWQGYVQAHLFTFFMAWLALQDPAARRESQSSAEEVAPALPTTPPGLPSPG